MDDVRVDIAGLTRNAVTALLKEPVARGGADEVPDFTKGKRILQGTGC